MRAYPIKIKNELQEQPEDRISIDAEDLYNMMTALELVNNNVFDNWQDLKARITEILSNAMPTAAEQAQEAQK